MEQQDKLMARMDTLADHIRDYEKAGNNVFTRSQARRLDKYLYRKSRQAAGKIGIDSTLRKSDGPQPCHLSRKSERILTVRVPLFHRYSAKFYNFGAS